MKNLALLLLAVVAATVTLLFVRGTDDVPSESVRDYLVKHPEFLADHPELVAASRQVLRERLLAAQGSQRAELIEGSLAPMLHAAFTPTLGRSDGQVLLLEFTDYTCEPCRASAPAVTQLLASRSEARAAILLLPTGGAMAEYMARVAYAAYKQHPAKFADLHRRLMELPEAAGQARILDAATAAGLDIAQLERDVSAPENRAYLEQVRVLAEQLGVTGVPAFASRDKLLLGGATAEKLAALISDRPGGGQ